MHALLRRQLRNAFPGGVPDAPGLGPLLEAVGLAYVAADDDRRQLEHSLQLASDELYERNGRLESQIAELERLKSELDRRNRAMALILDNVAQGFVTVGLDGSISNECSRAMARWFGPPAAGVRIWTHIAGHDPDLETWMQLAFETLASGMLPTEVALGQLPSRLDRDDHKFHVEYLPIGAPLMAVLVVVSDITAELAREHAEKTQRELISVVEYAYRDRSGFLAFIRETTGLLQHIEAGDLPFEDLKRHVHTIKGSAALFGVLSLSEICHELEAEIAAEGANIGRSAFAPLKERWRVFHDRVDRLLGVSERRTILVDWDEYQSVLAQLGDPEPSWAMPIRRWGQDATRVHLERFADQARQLARRLGRAELDVEIRDNDLRVDTDRFAPLWSAFVHAVRNAVDHGVETADARRSVAKADRARLVLRTELRDGDLAIEIEDDGRGIDWRAVAVRARELGLPAETAHDLRAAVFASGVSTTRDATQISGRGVGMSALLAACSELGGHVDLLSEPGRGTTVRCVVPLKRRTRRMSNPSARVAF